LLIVVYIPSPFRRHLIPARRRLTLKFIRPFITRGRDTRANSARVPRDLLFGSTFDDASCVEETDEETDAAVSRYTRPRFRFHLSRCFLPLCTGIICYLLAAVFILLIIFTYAPGIHAPCSLSSVNCAFVSLLAFPSGLSFPFSPFSPFASPPPPFSRPSLAPRSSPRNPRGLVFRSGARFRSRYRGARIAREYSRLSADWLCQTFRLSSVRYEASDKFSIDATSFGRSADTRAKARRREGNAPGVVSHFGFISRPRTANSALHRLFSPLGQLLQSRWRTRFAFVIRRNSCVAFPPLLLNARAFHSRDPFTFN